MTEAEAATAAGMAAAHERQVFYMQNPQGVTVPGDLPEWHSPGPSPVPRGLGYMLPPDLVPVFVAGRPGLVPQPVTPPPVTPDPAPSLTGASHGGWAAVPGGDWAAVPGAGIVYVSPSAAPRRSLWARLTGRSR